METCLIIVNMGVFQVDGHGELELDACLFEFSFENVR